MNNFARGSFAGDGRWTGGADIGRTGLRSAFFSGDALVLVLGPVVVAAAGCVPESVAPFDPADLAVTISGVQVCRGGGLGEDRSAVDMTPRETLIEVDLGAGEASGDIWTNDLTHDYVEENSAYSS